MQVRLISSYSIQRSSFGAAAENEFDEINLNQPLLAETLDQIRGSSPDEAVLTFSRIRSL